VGDTKLWNEASGAVVTGHQRGFTVPLRPFCVLALPVLTSQLLLSVLDQILSCRHRRVSIVKCLAPSCVRFDERLQPSLIINTTIHLFFVSKLITTDVMTRPKEAVIKGNMVTSHH